MLQVKARKEFVVTIDGPSVDTLREVCEAARIHLFQGNCDIAQWDGATLLKLRTFLAQIFEETG